VLVQHSKAAELREDNKVLVLDSKVLERVHNKVQDSIWSVGTTSCEEPLGCNMRERVHNNASSKVCQ
jgi:chemotaxis methyl-accepting protein methylase